MTTPASLGLPTYPTRALDIARFRHDPADDVIARYIDDWDPKDVARFWGAIGDREVGTLILFANRSAVLALRTHSAVHAIRSVAAHVMIPSRVMDARDRVVGLVRFALHATDADQGEIAQILDRAEPPIRKLLGSKTHLWSRPSLEGSGYIAVNSRYGLGLMDCWDGPPPRRSDLPTIAMNVADALEDASIYEVVRLEVSELPLGWLEGAGATSSESAGGCVAIRAGAPPDPESGNVLSCSVADVGHPALAEQLMVRASEASTPHQPVAGIARGQLFLLLSGTVQSRASSSIETGSSLAQLAPILAARLD